MSEFDIIRNELNAARKHKAGKKQELFLAGERLKKAENDLKQLERMVDPENPLHASQRKKLETQIRQEKKNIAEAQGAYAEVIAEEKNIYGNFAFYTDPRKLISGFSDSYPILLFPLRIETRFKKVMQNDTLVDELWLRIYPDDCMINTFEAIPSDTELDNTEYYWSQFWQAGGVEAMQRAAWRTLVSSHGSGRAKWLIQKFRPENETGIPVKIHPEDVALVIPVHDWPPNTEQDHILTYWCNMWKSDGDVALQTNEFNTLAGFTGEARAKEIAETLIPANINARPGGSKKVSEVDIQAVFLKFPERSTIQTKADSWSQAPRVDHMPERFVVTLYSGKTSFDVIGNLIPSPLHTGPDPSLSKAEIIQKKKGMLQFDEGMRWMADFDEAVRIGMGFKIPLTPAQAKQGFDRITVAGLRVSSDATQGAAILESLIRDHSNSRKGFEILAQGTATNNTDTEGSGYISADDPDVSYDELQKASNFGLEDEQHRKKDGQLLAEYLGLDTELFQRITGSGRSDQRDAWAINTALWPATMGYMMESLMQPVFTENDIANTREYFTRYVSGRGTIPAIRIGRQPYGILPVTKFDAMRWFAGDQQPTHLVMHVVLPLLRSYLTKLYAVLSKIDNDWSAYLSKVSYVGKSGDAHQLLLDVVGLNPVSVEFYRRYAESVESLYNRLLFFTFGKSDSIIPGGYLTSGLALLQSFGYTGEEIPEILNKIFVSNQDRMNPFLVDDRPLSEKEVIRNYMADGQPPQNYIEWLINAVRQSHDTLRKQQGFKGNQPPVALLYLMLHHALDLSYVEVSFLLHLQAKIMDTAQVRTAKIDPVFVHVQQQSSETESKWKYLYKTEQTITGSPAMQIGEYIPKLFGTAEVPAAYMNRMLEALEDLKNLSTASLERAFTEHIDCCTYRLDAWKNGFFRMQLDGMRYNRWSGETETLPRKGIYLGAYGYLENVRSENKKLSPVKLTGELLEFFGERGLPALMKDETNQGYILAPSQNHAVTAAILRNGYMANASSSNPDTLKVNISSERMRKALSVIEGIRGGQSLGALLGYNLERGLHDHHPGLELDIYIYELRKAFPLRGNRLKSTYAEDAAAEEIDARNVVDGLALINHIRRTGNKNYPFGKSLLAAGALESSAIDEEVGLIMDMNDAIADAAIAESVHQIVQGNYDRGNATLDTFSKGNFPPIPDVIQTPRSGMNITHRVGLQFETGLDSTVSPVAGMSMTPRAMAEPAVNKWLAAVLPPPGQVVCDVEYWDFAAGHFVSLDPPVTQKDLGLQPIDMICIAGTEGSQAMSSLDDRIIHYVLSHNLIRPDAEIRLNYTKSFSDRSKVTFFELTPLLKSLRALILQSKPLEANDVARPVEVKLRSKPVSFLDENRLRTALTPGSTRLTNLNTLISSLATLLSDIEVNREAILTGIDTHIQQSADKVLLLNDFISENTGIGYATGWKSDTCSRLIDKIQKLVTRWESHLTKYDGYLDAYQNPATPLTRAEQEKLLQSAERQVTTAFTYPIPADLSVFVTHLGTLRTAFSNKLDQFRNCLTLNSPSLFALLSDYRSKLTNFDLFDSENEGVRDIEDAILLFTQDLHDNLAKLHAGITDRFTKAGDLLDSLPAVGEASKKVEIIQKASKWMYGEEFLMIPEFTVTGNAADEWQNAWNDRDQLLAFSAPSGSHFPVDDWMHSVARVRSKIRHLENAVLLSEAFNTQPLTLHPLQLPYQSGDSWVAVEFPEDYKIDNDKVLYTAIYPGPFDKNSPQCGVLIDEWTEVIPSEKETAGVVFHYDKPNSEPPQVMLLAMPTDFRGQWQWADLLEIINDTFVQAKKRAIEPDHTDQSSYAWFLPAVISSVVGHRIAPSLNLALAETKLFQFLDLSNNE